MSPSTDADLTVLPAAFLTVSVAVTRSENRAATTSSSLAPSPFGDSEDGAPIQRPGRGRAPSRAGRGRWRGRSPLVEVPSSVAAKTRVPSVAGASSPVSRSRVASGDRGRRRSPTGPAAFASEPNSPTPSAATTSAAPGTTKSAGLAPVGDGSRARHGGRPEPEVADDRAVEARRRRGVGVHLVREAGRALRRERPLEVAVPGRRVAEDLVERAVGREQLADLAGRRVVRMALGDHRPRARADEPGAVVVDPLAGFGERALRQPGLGVPRRVAQVVQEHDRVGRQADVVPDVVLAVVDVLVAVGARLRVETEAVLGHGLERRVDARPAVAVAEVDEHARALRRGLDRRPGRVGREQRHDVGRVLAGLGGDVARVGLVVRVVVADGSDDDHDLGRRPGVDRQGREAEGEQQGDEDGGGDATQRAGLRDEDRSDRATRSRLRLDCSRRPRHGTSLEGPRPTRSHRPPAQWPGEQRQGIPAARPHGRGRAPRRRVRRARLPAVPGAPAIRGRLPRVDPGRERQRHPVPRGARRRARVLRAARRGGPRGGPAAGGDAGCRDPAPSDARAPPPRARGGECRQGLEPGPPGRRRGATAGVPGVRARRADGRGPRGEPRRPHRGRGMGRRRRRLRPCASTTCSR